MMESRFWKRELLSAASQIERGVSFKRYSEKRSCLLERSIMVAMFCVRALIERSKITDALIRRPLIVQAYRKQIPKLTTLLNNHRIDELFDTENPVRRTIDLEFLCNQIIHSYIIFPLCAGKRFTELLVCSDYERNRWLYLVPVEMIVSLLRDVGENFPGEVHSIWDPKRKDYIVRAYWNMGPRQGWTGDSRPEP